MIIIQKHLSSNNSNIVDFNGANATDSFNFKAKITGQTNDDGEIDKVEIIVPWKSFSNFWRTFEMPLTNCEVNHIMTWSADCVIVYTNVGNQGAIFEITETNLYVPVVTLLTQDNAKCLSLLKSHFKRAINWNKHLSKPELLRRNPNLNHLAEPSFQDVNGLFVLAFKNDVQRTSSKIYYLPNVEMKDYNIIIDGKSSFDQPVKNIKVTYENIRKIATGQGDGYTTGCLLDYVYFKNYYKIKVVDLIKQQALDADAKSIQQSNFTANLHRAENTRIYFVLELAKQTVLDFSQGIVKFL